MEKKYKIYYTDNYIEKIYQISNYIMYELQNPIASYQFQIKIMQTLSILNYFPQVGPKYKETKYHYLTMKHWIILYEIQENRVEIVKIFSSKQNPNSIQISEN